MFFFLISSWPITIVILTNSGAAALKPREHFAS